MRRAGPASLALAIVIAVIAVIVWRWVQSTRPDVVGPRFVDTLIERHPGLAVSGIDGAVLRTTTSSGLRVDVRLSSLLDTCRSHPLRCAATLDGALDEFAQVEALARDPRRSALAPVVVGGPAPGSAYGFVTDPLIGSLEVRYALVSGAASTFVTAPMLDQLGLTRATLKETAIANYDAIPALELEATKEQAIQRVRSTGDPVASLLDPARMKRFAARLNATTVYAAVPAQGVLYVAAAGPGTRQALAALLARDAGTGVPFTGASEVLAYDVNAAPEAALSIASNRP